MEFLKRLFQELEEAKIQYVVLRNYNALPFSTEGSDLDILINKIYLNKFHSILEDNLSNHSGHIVSIIQTSISEHLILLGKFQDNWWGVQIDIYYNDLIYKGHIYFPNELIWVNTAVANKVRILIENISYFVSFSKELLHTSTVKHKYITNIKNVLSQDTNKFQKILNTYLSSDYIRDFNNELKKNPTEIQFKKLRNDFKKEINYSLIKHFLYDLRLLKRILLDKPGYTVAILGTDGSGKSTVIDKIKEPLNGAFHNAVYYEHLRPNYFPSLAKLFGKENLHNGPVTNPHNSSTSGTIGSFFRWTYYMLDYTIGFYKKIWIKKAIRSCVWIFDRYYYDYLIDQKRSRIKLPKWLIRAGQFLIPKPDIILCLGTDPEIIHNRKPELPLSEVKRQIDELKTFCNGNKKAVWIDTGKSIKESSNDALNAVMEMMSKRFESVKLD